MGKKYGTLDEALTAGTGMDAKQREAFRTKIDKLMTIREKSKEGSKAWRDASNEVAKMHGWPQTY